ncbi:glycosyltransferase family 2 protein [Herminiimonas fonticola]|uniref:Cellulose synthase/poly-beta-1,6-N-acetylglucosamine synthase-like glycosyltransferase n=1 Tax=Herminiimonas fonticola TaxID=303380 RepID=A0A4V3BV35_9BURK|nr:glycosyltransferase [Herminiimonas fonticola]RBA23060.1 Glycosyltransferase like family 2 [Herminiimonas fonticola]TDN89498.1 cellulose synthase/poly-beta-1,6-N-acetylglucosamine synthase-like glycosyltransferase [Herminiimonas fonticola]
MTLSSLITAATWCILGYFIVSKISYFLLNALSIFRMHRMEQGKILADLPQIYSGLEQPISLLLRTHNSAATIATSVHALLKLDYSNFEIIVINDGSQDATLDTLLDTFDLHAFPEAYRIQLATQEVHCIYRSTRYPNLRVIDKKHGGKADALNAGINASRYPLFCSVDDHTILHRDSLRRMAAPFLNDNTVIATAGAVRVANGCEVENGLLNKVALPKRWLPVFQIVEYLRTSLFAPLGWSTMNGMLIVPAAGVGLFQKEAVIEVGGYRTDTTTGNMELIVRMHRLMRKKQQEYQITFVADPVCWQQVPQDLAALRNQRMHWQQGLLDSLSQNMGLLFSRNGGVPGRLAFPFFIVFECVGPILELFGYAFILLAYACGLLSLQACMAFFSVAIGLGILLSASGLLLEEMSFHLYPKASDIVKLAIVAILGNLGYRQLNIAWRSYSTARWLMGQKYRTSSKDIAG